MKFKLAIFFLVMQSAPVLAASFDCKKSINKVENIICSDVNSSKMDEYFSKFYVSINSNLSVRERDTLKDLQIDWLKSKRNRCEDSKCIVSSYEARIDEIEAWLKGRTVEPLESEKLNEPLTERQKVWKELEPKYYKLQEAVEVAYRAQLKEAYYGPNTNNALGKLAEAKRNWELFRASYCDAVSGMYGGLWASFHETECKIDLAEAFIKINQKFSP